MIVPSPRLLAVTALLALGGIVAVVGTGAGGPKSSPDVRGALAGGVVPAASPAPSAAGGGAAAIRAENDRPGAKGWRIGSARAAAPGLSAYATEVSVRPGTEVPLRVNGDGTVLVRVFRLGYYGGRGARQIGPDTTLHATPQTGAVAGWVARRFVDTTGWPGGVYLIRLDLGPASRYVPLTVAAAGPGGSTGSAGRTVVMTSPLTWAAAVARGSQVSLDQPLTAGAGAGGLLADAGLVAGFERTGGNLVYVTDVDVDRDPGLLTGAAAVLVDGDSRYWTAGMRSSFRAAAAAGTNLAFFGSGTATARITAGTTARTFVTGTVAATTSARLTGQIANCAAVAPTGWRVDRPGWWGFQGTSVKNGEILPGLVSGRTDRAGTQNVVPGRPAADQAGPAKLAKPAAPAGTAGAALVVGGARDLGLSCPVAMADAVPADAVPAGAGQDSVYLVRPSGAAIFSAGTQAWTCTVSGSCPTAKGTIAQVDPRTRRVAARITRNLVQAFAAPRAGLTHPVPSS